MAHDNQSIARALKQAACLVVLGVAGCGGVSGLTSTETIEPPSVSAQKSIVQKPLPAPASETIATVENAKAELANISDDELNSAAIPAANIFGEVANHPTEARGGSSEFGFQQHTFIEEGFDSEPAISPDGKWVAYASTRHAETTDIYLQKVDGLAVTQLTSDAADDEFPTFAPDGQRLAFASNRSGTWDLYMMDRTGRNITQITSGPSHDMHPSFSPDGTRLVYCSLTPRGQWEMWIVNITTGERKMIGYGLFPQWSPQKDKDLIAFQRSRNRGGRWFSLWTCELIDGEARSVTEVAVSNKSAVVSPCWAPDGKRLTFTTIIDPGKLDSRGKPMGQQDVWTVNADGTGKHRITDGKGINTSPVWSNDNRIYFISNRGGSDCVWSVSAGGEAKPAPGTTATTSAPEN